ncbi:MAG: hypothetical protein AMXMBFR84_00090 [Candidatus Hydrogenedentota bacterium]
MNRHSLLLLALTVLVACGAPWTSEPLAFTLPDANGIMYTPTEPPLQGRPILLYAFGVWCGPCKALSPEIERLYAAYASKGLAVIGVHFAVTGGSTEDYQQTLRDYAQTSAIAFPLLVGGHTSEVSEALPTVGALRGYPTTLLFDREGNAKKKWLGYHEGMPKEIESAIRAVLTSESN